MEFYLTYRGPLKANGSSKDKQNIRREFHKQLKELCSQPHMQEFGLPKFLKTDDKSKSIITKQIDKFELASLVSEQLNMIAELDITLLRPEQPGSIVTKGGDIDNRLKTLFDSLKIPNEPSEIPPNDSPQEGEEPFFCLLEDDKLITKLCVGTGQLLEPCKDSSFVSLLIHVQTKVTEITSKNIGLP